MGLFGWWKREARNGARASRDIDDWRRDWAAAAAAPSAEQIRALGERLAAFGLDEEEIDVEREMLDGLERFAALAADVRERGLPSLETGHRIAGSDVCHFSAPASMPDDPGQPAGRLLLTSVRIAFAGGAASRTIPWHAISSAVRQDRDLLFDRAGRQDVLRFRCNSYGDALCGALIAARLVRPRGAQGHTVGEAARRPRV
jgi:hypothetical protein